MVSGLKLGLWLSGSGFRVESLRVQGSGVQVDVQGFRFLGLGIEGSTGLIFSLWRNYRDSRLIGRGVGFSVSAVPGHSHVVA